MLLPFLTVSQRIVRGQLCRPNILVLVSWKNFCSVLNKKYGQIMKYSKQRWDAQQSLGSTKEVYLNKMKTYALSDRQVQGNELLTFILTVDNDSLPYVFRLLKVSIYNGDTNIKNCFWETMQMFTYHNASEEAHSFMQLLMNTSESLDQALKHLKECKKSPAFVLHGAQLKHMVAHLTLQQNRNTECLELLVDTKTNAGIQMQAAALARFGEFHAAKILLAKENLIYREILKDILHSVGEHGHKDLDASEIIVFRAQQLIQTARLQYFTLTDHFRKVILHHHKLTT